MTEPADRGIFGRVLPRNSELSRLANQPVAFARTHWIALLMLLVGSVADLLTTYHNIRLYGPAVETHLVQRWVFERAGAQCGVPLAKVVQFGFVLLVAAWWRPWTRWILALCGLLYLAAAISNWFLLL